MRFFGMMAATVLIASNATAQPATDFADEALEAARPAPIFNVATAESCIGGHNPFSVGTTTRIRGLAEETLAAYVALAGASGVVNARPLYTPKKHSQGWGETSFVQKRVVIDWFGDGVQGAPEAVDDALARAIVRSGRRARDALKLETFLIGGAKISAMGTWRVADPDDPSKTLGRYRVRFLRENSLGGQAWLLLRVEVFTDSETPAEVKQYCAEPGDVELNRERLRGEQMRREQLKLEREKRRQAN